ncbi:MAG: DUF427 domain-containing protein [Saprospiraceae bacterium]|nr:DUF427 domain-containing protein [Saprospiraceae bacterium]
MKDIESVWDYPRPPLLVPFSGHIRIIHKDSIIVDSNQVFRILETSHPPTYYFPLLDISPEFLAHNQYTTYCEFKGQATYFDLIVNEERIESAGWYYGNPNKHYAALKGYAAVYASKLDACYVNDEKVKAQEGDFYGGWITSHIKGPFKGGKGTYGW